MKRFISVRTLSAALLALAVAAVSAGPAGAKPKDPDDDGVRCMYIDPNTGEMEFFMPGQTIWVTNEQGAWELECLADGNWAWTGQQYKPASTPAAPRPLGR